jgi:predicted nucleic acid-binding protein
VLADTNILVRLRDADDPRHLPCVEALQRLQNAGDEACICAQVLIEYWVVATRPQDVNGLGIEPAAVETDIQDFQQAFTVLPEPPDMAARWLMLAVQYTVRGRQAHDTRLAALILAHGVTRLLTLNPDDFARYDGIVCLAPEDV